MTTSRAILFGVSGLLALALTGCAGSGADSSPDPTVLPSGAPTGLPSGAELVRWAETMLPSSQLGGAAYALRTSGALTPEQPVALDLTPLTAREAQLQVACLSADGGSVVVQISGADDVAVPCGTPGADEPATVIELAPAAEVSLSAEESAVYVFAATPREQPAR